MFPTFLTEPVDLVAPKLLGCLLERTLDDRKITFRIVETEAYDQTDEASHTFRGKTTRNAVMFGECGFLYVYFIYGMHYCCNVVTGENGFGSAVLIRAVEPEGNGAAGMNLLPTNGPARLCRSLGIDRAFNGHDLRREPLRLIQGALRPEESITRTTRIGISRAAEKLRRYYIAENRHVSKP